MNNEPVAWIDPYDLERLPHHDCWVNGQEHKNSVPLYTHPANPKYDPETGEPLIDGYPLFSGLPPPPAKTLTDEEIWKIYNTTGLGNGMALRFARAILRKAQKK